MKEHTTNYFNTLIQIAPDCPVDHGIAPPPKNPPTIAQLQYEMILNEPYTYTSDDVIFGIWTQRQGIDEKMRGQARSEFFSKGQPCLRSSPLGKTYGWGIHTDDQGRVALVDAASDSYRQMVHDQTIVKTQAMKSKR